MTLKEEVVYILAKDIITEEDTIRLSVLYADSKKLDNGKSYLDAYNTFIKYFNN